MYKRESLTDEKWISGREEKVRGHLWKITYSLNTLNTYSPKDSSVFFSALAHDKYSATIWFAVDKKLHQRRIKTSPLSGARPRIISADQSHYLFEVGQVLERPTDETVTIIKRLGEKLIIIEAVCLSKSMTGSPDGWAGRRGTRTNAFFIPSSICIYLTFTVLEDILRWY